MDDKPNISLEYASPRVSHEQGLPPAPLIEPQPATGTYAFSLFAVGLGWLWVPVTIICIAVGYRLTWGSALLILAYAMLASLVWVLAAAVCAVEMIANRRRWPPLLLRSAVILAVASLPLIVGWLILLLTPPHRPGPAGF